VSLALLACRPRHSGDDGSGPMREDIDDFLQEFNVDLLPWGQAAARAAEVEAKLTDMERHSLLVGQNFGTFGGWVGSTKAVPRMGIPSLKMQDSSSGFRPLGPGEPGTVTAWPSMLALASSWDESLVWRVARAIAAEFKGKGANMILGPGLNVHRSPYGGRNWEYLSGEDPYLGSRLAPAFVTGVQSQGVMATVKHFAFNEQETKRKSENSVVREKTAWELYYPPFEAALAAGAGSVMCAYNSVNGYPACGSRELLVDTLKGRMGFEGFVVSDWGAVTGADALDGGVDMEQPADVYFRNATDSPVAREAARRVLTSIFHMRLDEHPGCELPCSKERASNQRTADHMELAHGAAANGIVLLQNQGVLPLKPGSVQTLAVLGAAAEARDTMNTWGPGSPYSGGGSGHVPAPDVVSPLEGIRRRAAKANIKVIADTTSTNHGVTALDPAEVVSRRLSSLEKALDLAREADVVVVVGATTATESRDRPSLSLDDNADDLIMAVSKLKPTIVLLEVPGAILTPWRDQTAAIACLFYGGERTGDAWASVLFGDIAPSGKLPIMLPSSETGLVTPGLGTVVYDEGIRTSYRSPTAHAAYPFGHGLTYTAFEFSRPRAYTKGCEAMVCVSLRVTNIGVFAGREVVQAYLYFPDDTNGAAKMLRGFQKTSLLNPGAGEDVILNFSQRDLSTYDGVAHAWQRHENVVIFIGSSSVDLRNAVTQKDVDSESFQDTAKIKKTNRRARSSTSFEGAPSDGGLMHSLRHLFLGPAVEH